MKAGIDDLRYRVGSLTLPFSLRCRARIEKKTQLTPSRSSQVRAPPPARGRIGACAPFLLLSPTRPSVATLPPAPPRRHARPSPPGAPLPLTPACFRREPWRHRRLRARGRSLRWPCQRHWHPCRPDPRPPFMATAPTGKGYTDCWRRRRRGEREAWLPGLRLSCAAAGTSC